MVDPKKQAELDQAIEMMAQNFPVLLWRFYKGLVEQGFGGDAALQLTQTWLSSTVMAGAMMKPPNG